MTWVNRSGSWREPAGDPALLQYEYVVDGRHAEGAVDEIGWRQSEAEYRIALDLWKALKPSEYYCVRVRPVKISEALGYSSAHPDIRYRLGVEVHPVRVFVDYWTPPYSTWPTVPLTVDALDEVERRARAWWGRAVVGRWRRFFKVEAWRGRE